LIDNKIANNSNPKYKNNKLNELYQNLILEKHIPKRNKIKEKCIDSLKKEIKRTARDDKYFLKRL
jgi:hypothetical protein